MRIDSSMMLQQTSQTSIVQKRLSSIMQKLSTGVNINSAADDPAGNAIAQRLEAMARGYKTSGDNIGDALSAMNIADAGASDIGDALQRQRELAVQASSDTLSSKDRQSLDQEYQQLNQEIASAANGTQYNTMDLLNGQSPLSNGTGTIQVGASANPSSQLSSPNVDMTPGSIGAGGSIATAAGAKAALNSIDSAMDKVQSQRATIGATSNRLDYADRLNSLMEINTTSAQSQIQDLDYAQSTMDLATSNILSQSSISAMSNFNQISRNTVLGLLQ